MFEHAHQVAVEAAREAGRAVRRYYQDEYTVTDKGEDNPLTDADLASDRILMERLLAAFPDYGWLSEETADDGKRVAKDLCWIVDPLDGTKEFTKGIPEFVVSVGLVAGGHAVLGVLYNPIKDQLFSGYLAADRATPVGAWLNDAPVRVTDRAALTGARVVCSRTEMSKGWFEDYKDQLIPEPVGSVAYKFGLVAAGRADATFTPRPRHEWDVAAGAAIVAAAGGRVSNRHGADYVFNKPHPKMDGVAATNGHIHEAILGLMKD